MEYEDMEQIAKLEADLAAAQERIAVIEEAMSDVMKTCVATVQLVAKAAEVAAPENTPIVPTTRDAVLERMRTRG